MITLEQRKLLTEEVLGECWHKLHRSPKYDDISGLYCSKCKTIAEPNRTFDNWTDFGAVVEKLLTTKTDAFDLSEFFEGKYHNESDNAPIYEVWLLNPERFCILVAEAVEADWITSCKQVVNTDSY